MVELRRLGPDDIAVLNRVAEEVFDGPIQPDRAIAFLAAPDHLMIVALANGAVIGQCRGMVQHAPDAASTLYIDNLGVAPAFQRQGIGRQLIQDALAWGRESGCETAWVATEQGNTSARILYRSTGFAGESVAYFERKL